MKRRILKLANGVCIICIISCILLSSYLASDVWARYFTVVSGSGSVSVAKWDVATSVAEGQSTAFSLSNGSESATYSFAVTSRGEVALEYDVVLIFPEALTDPACISFIMQDMDGNSVTASTEDGKVYTFSNIGTFTANGGMNNHTLTIRANNFIYRINQSEIVVKIVARQVH